MNYADLIRAAPAYRVPISNTLSLSVSTLFLLEANNKEIYPPTAVETALFTLDGNFFIDEDAGYQDVCRFSNRQELVNEIFRLIKYYKKKDNKTVADETVKADDDNDDNNDNNDNNNNDNNNGDDDHIPSSDFEYVTQCFKKFKAQYDLSDFIGIPANESYGGFGLLSAFDKFVKDFNIEIIETKIQDEDQIPSRENISAPCVFIKKIIHDVEQQRIFFGHIDINIVEKRYLYKSALEYSDYDGLESFSESPEIYLKHALKDKIKEHDDILEGMKNSPDYQMQKRCARSRFDSIFAFRD